MKELDFNQKITDQKGNDVDGKTTLADVLSLQLYNTKGETSEQAFRMYDWSIELAKTGKISLSITDAEMLFKAVEKLPLNNNVLVPILRKIKDAKQ